MKRVVLLVVVVLASAGLFAWTLRPNSHSGPRSTGSGNLVAAPTQVHASAAVANRFLDRSTLRPRDDFVTPDGFRFTVLAGRTGDGSKVCAATEGEGFGTSSCADNLSETPLIWGESFSAGPGGTKVTDWEVSGLAGPQVERVVVVDSTGRTRPARLSHGAFFFALSHGELKHGITGKTLEAYDAAGTLVDAADL